MSSAQAMLAEVDCSELVGVRATGQQREGYAHDVYALSLAEFGNPLRLRRSGAWVLVRSIPGTCRMDAIGPYPFFCCDDFAGLAADLEEFRGDWVSFAAVPDPFSCPSAEALNLAFDRVVRFKRHYLVDLSRDFPTYLHRHHRRYSRGAFDEFTIEVASPGTPFGVEWAQLYKDLIMRKEVVGIQAFSRGALAAQLGVPGCTYIRAIREGQVEAALVCYLDRGAAYTHLVSATNAGQRLRAQYALYHTAIQHYRGKAAWLLLGSVPGSGAREDGGGLEFFKAGWATHCCWVVFCGRVLDRAAYDSCAVARGASGSEFFPAYRTP